MAALAAVEHVTFDAGSLMNKILEHEERFWVREASDLAGVATVVPLARQLVAAATLRGGLTTKEARELCARFEERPRTDHDDALIALLHHIYEGADKTKYLPGLEPDLLGEGMVLRIATPPAAGDPGGDTWIEHVLVAGDDARAVTTAFTGADLGSSAICTSASSMTERNWTAALRDRSV
jgi:hypothetical protein